MLRLYAVYPISSTGKATFGAIFSFPVAVTTARIVIVCTGTALYARTVTNVTDPTLAESSNVGLVHMPLFKVEGALALAEHMYVTKVPDARPAPNRDSRAHLVTSLRCFCTSSMGGLLPLPNLVASQMALNVSVTSHSLSVELTALFLIKTPSRVEFGHSSTSRSET